MGARQVEGRLAATLAPDNATGNFIEIVQRVPASGRRRRSAAHGRAATSLVCPGVRGLIAAPPDHGQLQAKSLKLWMIFGDEFALGVQIHTDKIEAISRRGRDQRPGGASWLVLNDGSV